MCYKAKNGEGAALPHPVWGPTCTYSLQPPLASSKGSGPLPCPQVNLYGLLTTTFLLPSSLAPARPPMPQYGSLQMSHTPTGASPSDSPWATPATLSCPGIGD